MKTLNNQNSYLNDLEGLSTHEMSQIVGGGWLSDAAEFVGFCVGYVGHAVIDAALLVTGNFGDHKPSSGKA